MKKAAILILILLVASCATPQPQLKLGDVYFITYPDGSTELDLSCLNLSDMWVLGVTADVVVAYIQSQAVIDRIHAEVGDIKPQDMKRFSVFTDKLTFGEDIGVKAEFIYKNVI